MSDYQMLISSGLFPVNPLGHKLNFIPNWRTFTLTVTTSGSSIPGFK